MIKVAKVIIPDIKSGEKGEQMVGGGEGEEKEEDGQSTPGFRRAGGEGGREGSLSLNPSRRTRRKAERRCGLSVRRRRGRIHSGWAEFISRFSTRE